MFWFYQNYKIALTSIRWKFNQIVCNFWRYRLIMPLTIAWDELAVLQFVVFRRSFACGSLHEKILAVGALGCAIIQWRTLLVERTPRLVPVRLTFGGEESGTVFGVARLERPVRTGLLDSSLPWWWRIIWIHGGHIAVWDARICVHTDKNRGKIS